MKVHAREICVSSGVGNLFPVRRDGRCCRRPWSSRILHSTLQQLKPKSIATHDIVFANFIPTKQRKIYSEISTVVLMLGFLLFCNRGPRRTRRNNLKLTVVHDYDGVLFKGMAVSNCAVELGLLAGCLVSVKRRLFVLLVLENSPVSANQGPNYYREFHHSSRANAVAKL